MSKWALQQQQQQQRASGQDTGPTYLWAPLPYLEDLGHGHREAGPRLSWTMTSLFHRTISRSHGTSSHRTANSSSSSNSGGDGSGTGGGTSDNGGTQLNNNSAPGRPQRVVHRLEFNQAMGDFRTMFPGVERQVIECVLWANNGVVEATIEQLLQMSIDGQGTDDSSDSEDSIPPEVSHI